MSSYFRYFIEGPEQAVALGSVLLVWLGMTWLGALVSGRGRLVEADPLCGWAVVVLAMTVPAVFLAVPFTATAIVLLLAAAGAALWTYRRDRRLMPPGAVKVAVLAAPLLILVSAMAGSQWDEFSHWLPTIRYISEVHEFPGAGAVDTGGAFPGYPYAWPLLSYLAGQVAGTFIENAGALMNVLLLLGFGMVAVRLILTAAGADPDGGRGWRWAGLAAMAVLLTNPVFSQKIVLTAYADTSSAVAVGLGCVLGWRMLEALADGDRRRARMLAWQLGLVSLVLVNIKQANLVLWVLLLAGVGLAGLRDPRVGGRAMAPLLPVLLLPPAVIYGVWRFHVLAELPPGAEAVFMPMAKWNIELIPQIVTRMIIVLGKKGYYLGLMVLAVAFGIRGLARFAGPLDRLAIIVGVLFVGYNAFLLLIFVTQFGEFDALRVASLWRYNMHLGLAALAFGAFGAGHVWRRFLASRLPLARVGWLPIVLVLAAPFVFAPKLRFDLAPLKPHYRAVAAQLPGLLPRDARMVIVDPLGTGESMVISRYHVRDAFKVTGYLAAYHGADRPTIRHYVKETGADTILVYSVTPPVRQAMGGDLAEQTSHLFRADGKGGWRLIRSWPHDPGALREK